METTVATRRRGAASLDDLKARLGYSGPNEAVPDTENSEAASEEAEEAASDEGAAEPATADSAPAAAPSVATDDAGIFDEDYSDAVAEESPAEFTYDPNQVDADIKAPASKTLLATVLATAAALLVGVAIGVIGTANNTVRSLENATTTDAGVLLEAVRPVAGALTALDGDLAAIPAETQYSPEFEERLRATFTGGDLPVLEPGLVAAAKTLMVVNDSLGRQLVDYAVATNYLNGSVERHLRATEVDADEITALQAGTEDNTNYGIAIEFETLLNRFQMFIQDAEANPFSPIAAERVTYDSLEMIVEGEDDEQREFYAVTTATGDNINVLIHDLVLLPREQLLPPISSENALDRYRARATQIKEMTAQVTTMQADLLAQLEDLADNQIYFTF